MGVSFHFQRSGLNWYIIHLVSPADLSCFERACLLLHENIMSRMIPKKKHGSGWGISPCNEKNWLIRPAVKKNFSAKHEHPCRRHYHHHQHYTIRTLNNNKHHQPWAPNLFQGCWWLRLARKKPTLWLYLASPGGRCRKVIIMGENSIQLPSGYD